ncbi:hypothetical protein [uncultured Chryseobacterium sp.]|uniref:hypothetical protein n=1 Tax=uncultured Chryseobacterium sp. TaxID=259322 RepID=UPI0025EBB078|nr:hypothetical protein [uncultured Chryseobacterium sp.]
MNNKKLLEKKDWEYYIFQQNDILELLVTVEKPNPGLDIIHQLNTSEKENYLKMGIQALEDRIKDMKENFSWYKVNSWR